MKIKFLPAIAAVVVFSLCLILACRRNDRLIFTKEKFDVFAAKEWYYTVFKKSVAFTHYSTALNGRKLPSWSKGKYKTIGNLEVVEFPLIKEKSSVFLKANSELTNAEKLKVLHAVLNRIIFVKTADDRVVIREIEYIPDWNYLQEKRFDISSNSFGAVDRNFSGTIIVKKWNGEVLSRNILSNGKIIRKGRIFKNGKSGNLRQIETNSVSSGQNCTTYLITEYEEHCVMVTVGDEPATEECEWIPTGVQWYEEICDNSESCDPGMSSEQCACMLYNLGCDGGGDSGNGDNNNNNNNPDNIYNEVDDPCLKDMVDESISRDCKNEISNFVNLAFGENPFFDITFRDEPLGSVNGDHGQTTAHIGGTGANATCYITVTLNSSPGGLPIASQEYIAATIFHEIVHGWIHATNTAGGSSNSVSHETMASSTNIQRLADALMEMFPGLALNPQDAIDLAWGGLEGTSAWAALTQAERNRIKQTNDDYRYRVKGSPCSP